MEKRELERAIADIYAADPPVAQIEGRRPDQADILLFDEPLVGIAAAEDPLFAKMKEPGVIGPGYLAPREWLSGAQSVISLFFPFSERVRTSNRGREDTPSTEWLYGRIEGQNYINGVMSRKLTAWLEDRGARVVAPMQTDRFGMKQVPNPEFADDYMFESTWSERHAAFVAGLGTFGLSRGLITERGVAGRFLGLVTDAEIEPDMRPYSDPYEYCIRCGACAPRCPVGAIITDRGRINRICHVYLDEMKPVYAPRYGCGKCQTEVPCEHEIPKR